jgi:hypothetical protein
MSLLIIERIYRKLQTDFNSYGLFDHDLEFIKDLIHVPVLENSKDYAKQVGLVVMIDYLET